MWVIDSTYNTTVYNLPLLVLCILTNVGYVSVASLLICDERQESIAAALKVIAEWNPEWKPSHVMTDFHEGQIAAVTSIFPGNCVEVTCLLCTSLRHITMLFTRHGRLMCLFVWFMSPTSLLFPMGLYVGQQSILHSSLHCSHQELTTFHFSCNWWRHTQLLFVSLYTDDLSVCVSIISTMFLCTDTAADGML